MFCPNCGRVLMDDTSECMYCGYKTDLTNYNKKRRNRFKISRDLKSLLGISVVIVSMYLLFNNGQYDMTHQTEGELAYYSLRYAISKSALDGSGVLSVRYFEIIENMIKKQNITNEWFSRNTGTFYGKIEDFSDYEVTWISDGNYTAMLKIENKSSLFKSAHNYIVDYDFSHSTRKGYSFRVQ